MHNSSKNRTKRSQLIERDVELGDYASLVKQEKAKSYLEENTAREREKEKLEKAFGKKMEMNRAGNS